MVQRSPRRSQCRQVRSGRLRPAGAASLTIDFESFGPSDQGKRFGDDLGSSYQGFDWAYADSAKNDAWGSFSVQDSGAPGGNDSSGQSIPGAGGSENWLKARASSVGKGAKITIAPGEDFEFVSMSLYTQDASAFLGEVTVTWRTVDGTDTQASVALVDDSWIAVTAADLGISDGTLLKSMWFNGAPSNPNSVKFGLDDFSVKVGIVPEPGATTFFGASALLLGLAFRRRPGA